MKYFKYFFKKPTYRILIILPLAVILISGLVKGGITWHQQPRFCAMCHTPMTNYVQNYFKNDTTILIAKHAFNDSIQLKCVDCHKSNTSEQLREGANWVAGNYTFPLEKRKFGNRVFCLSCHNESKIIAATKLQTKTLVAYNPHSPRHGKQECYSCHSMHGNSVLTCNQCHKYELPKGWISPQPNGIIAESNKE